ncbi:MAG: hypothetical protein IAF38_00015 [Bacteroidia bacterium]|nr:hypothetical protein [Bacteroidia bacterium]
MKRKLIVLSVFCLSLFSLSNKVNAQCDTIANICAKHIISAFISDGQHYRAFLLNPDETAQFQTTFFGETTYRLAACSGTTDGNLIFTIKDQSEPEPKILFTNADYQNAPYWDFKVKSTIQVTIEAKLNPGNSGSGCAVLLIGFKQAGVK